MLTTIIEIEKGSPADKTKLSVGDRLVSINGREIRDVLDYKFFSYETKLLITAVTPEGKEKQVRIRKAEGQDLGLVFQTYLMDKARACANKCVFCFVDQLPRGMRKTLYFKDDDSRLSFLMGNYITLTNLSEREIQRICELRISPINISVHATDPEMRRQLLGNPRSGECMEIMRRFSQAGIVMNCQIVCCPDLNDGQQLQRSMEELSALYPQVKSVSVVPVGLTMHREGLRELTPFDKRRAQDTIRQVEEYAEKCLREQGSRIFFCADELYLKAGLELPEDAFYEEYVQLDNGVGMMRLLITEFDAALRVSDECTMEPFTVATGVAAAPFIEALARKAQEKFPGLEYSVYAIQNDFFGHSIDVAGLVTGGDLIRQLKEKEIVHPRLLIPQNMLRHGEGVFLDDVTVEDVEKALGVKVMPIQQDGGCLCDAMLGYE